MKLEMIDVEIGEQDLIAGVRSFCTPEDVFTFEELSNWAERNGFDDKDDEFYAGVAEDRLVDSVRN